MDGTAEKTSEAVAIQILGKNFTDPKFAKKKNDTICIVLTHQLMQISVDSQTTAACFELESSS